MRRLLLVILLLSSTSCVSDGNGRKATGGADGRLVEMVTTTTQLTDFVKVVGGAHVHVYGVLKANVDPHDYEPSPADLLQIRNADVLVMNGIGLEKWFESSIVSAAPKGEIVDASSGVKVRKGDGSDEEAEGDPHIWQNPRNAMAMVQNIERALVKHDPAHRVAYRGNAAQYLDQLGSLDREVARALAPLPNKKVVTNHDAFGYYIDRYGLDFVGSIIPSFDTQAELSARDVRDIVSKIKSTRVKAVFSESSLPPKTAETIGREAGVTVVAGADSLYGDTLGPPGSDGDTYTKMIRHNTKEFVDHLS